MAALDRIVSTDAAAYVRGYAAWDQFGVARPWRGSGAVGLFPIGDIANGDADHADALNEGRETEDWTIEDWKIEDQEILAAMIAPIARDQAEQISDDLISHFGSLPRVLAAFDDGIQAPMLPNIIGNHLRMSKLLISRLLRREAVKTPLLSATDDLLNYLHNEMSHLTRETMRVLFLDINNRLIFEKTMWEGTLASVQFHPREIIRLALQHHSSALILVHNHPSGNPEPSAADISVTGELCVAAAYLDILVHDHIIISGGGHISMRDKGLMNRHPHEGQNQQAAAQQPRTDWALTIRKLMVWRR